MAFPFPRLGSTPSTPKPRPDIETPSTSMTPRKSNGASASRRTAFALLTALALFMWMISPFTGSSVQNDNVPFASNAIDDYFAHFEGHQDCGITSRDLYIPPVPPGDDHPKHKLYCSNRAALLEALSGGGRHGFERPYFPAGCHYRWYSTPEICMILDRFDAVIFIGDDTLKAVYAAFNMLLRENLAMGGLKQWELIEMDDAACRCDNQLIRPECMTYAVTDSQEIAENDEKSVHKSPYYCARTPHMFLPITDSPAPENLHTKFSSVLGNDPDSYKPVPVIHSLGLATSLSWPAATASMDEWLTLADGSGRNVPFLWASPNAAGHLKPPGQILSQGNNALWHYTIETMKEAKARELDSLGMYNLTLQANSWDGSYYGQKVGLVQAMTVINWLSRVEST